ncbi:RNase H domain-containing protein [Trichonephila clavipes]|uniref:RNase H domain-containing protein n=1 Tax=Trichonephila clavipes TaxID=2585209 RepID=A0A8X6W1U2_TRICX|nr:RNase H domain-containing protein [Trichonephila clavipes]
MDRIRTPQALAEHSGTAFTPRGTLPGEYSPDVLHPFRPGTPPRHDETACRKKRVEHSSLRPFVNPVEDLPVVYFHNELLSHTNKNSDVPEYLRQLALEIINDIPSDAILIYTDGSKDESNRTGSGAFIEKLSRRNPENCSVLRSELIAIDEGLKSILNSYLTTFRSSHIAVAPFNTCRTGLA